MVVGGLSTGTQARRAVLQVSHQLRQRIPEAKANLHKERDLPRIRPVFKRGPPGLCFRHGLWLNLRSRTPYQREYAGTLSPETFRFTLCLTFANTSELTSLPTACQRAAGLSRSYTDASRRAGLRVNNRMGEIKMKVFCPEHNRGFVAPRQNPIKCENRGHVLGELDFEGESQRAELCWQYCCNCEHFYPAGGGQDLIRCPVCARQCSLRYLCHRCYTISFESNRPTQTKNFTLTMEGMPQPSCPGCLQSAPADLREHACAGLGVSFITALSSCPICNERLDVAPAFPCSVAYYLKKTKAANKHTVTFDYECGFFVSVEDGEFVLIHNGDPTPIVLPRFSRFNTRRHFYDFYQDYYYCANPGAGEVQIIQPASADPVDGGWTLKSPGVLEILGPASETPPTNRAPDSAVAKPPVIRQPRAEIRNQNESAPAPCPHCGELVEARYAFCWNCGKAILATDESSVTRAARDTGPMAAAPMMTEDDEITARHRPVPTGPPIFSWLAPEEPDRNPSGSRSLLKLLVAVLAGVLLAALGLFVLVPWALRTTPTMASQTANLQSDTSPSPASENQIKPAADSAPERATVRPEDETLKNLRARRATADQSDRAALLKELTAAEEQFPNDYRFPYERAKLSINDRETHSHHEAFDALLLAAEKAIKSGKASEMLSSLEADKEGDLRKLARGHGEWKQLENALQSKDGSMLSIKTHH